MDVELLQLLSLMSYILAGVFFLVSIALFFLLGVPKLIGNLTGISERKAIKSRRQQNEDMGNKVSGNLLKNNHEGSITMSGSISQKRGSDDFNMGTEKFSTARLKSDNVSEETTILNMTQGETTVLVENQNDNNVRGYKNAYLDMPQTETYQDTDKFFVEYQLCFLGSSEIIE